MTGEAIASAPLADARRRACPCRRGGGGDPDLGGRVGNCLGLCYDLYIPLSSCICQ